MCGIAGIVKLDPAATVDAACLRRMRDALRHRGPDDAGYWIEGPVGLAHRRLAILDPAGGNQPMASSDGQIWIVYNGEIYNHPSLRTWLQAQGHRYRTRSDTETLLHLYEESRERCVERLQGMFAFALWDRQQRKLLLARDRLGIKPLYYACSSDTLIFASEIKAILASGLVRPALNSDVLTEYLAHGFVSGPETFFEGIYKLLPGRTLYGNPTTGLTEHRFWQLSAEPDPDDRTSLAQVASRIRTTLALVVRSHLLSDVPLGVFLSGGIDSSGLAALMASALPEPVQTFSVGFSETASTELRYARLMADAIGARHRQIMVTPQQFFAALPRLIWHEDEPIPFPSSVPLYFVSRLAREQVKVVLTGEGADELFLGYNRYRVSAWNLRLGRHWSNVPQPLRIGVRRLLALLPPLLRRHARRTFLALPPDCRALVYENFALCGQSLRERLLDQVAEQRDPHEEMLALYAQGAGGPVARMAHVDLQTYLVELLMKQDQMSMAASVESRVPFLDHCLVEEVVALPERFKLRGWQSKAVLREALRGLVPPPILTRCKMGFPVPMGRWLRGQWWPVIEDLLLSARARERGLLDPQTVALLAEEHRRGIANHAARLWLLMTLELWQRIFLDGEKPATLPESIAA